MWSRLTSQAHQTGRLLTLFAALSLLSMPVDYRGGAELPHAHALFQFWMSGDAGAFDHHGHQTHHAHHAEDAKVSANADSAPDTPSVSEMGSPAERGAGIALTMLLAMFIVAACGTQAIATRVSLLIGRLPAPEPPPPRSVPV